MLDILPADISKEILAYLSIHELCRLSLSLKFFAETSFYWSHVTTYRFESARMPSKPFKKSLMLDFLYRRAETLHPSAPVTIILDSSREDDADSWTQYLVAMSCWQTVTSVISAGSLHLAVLFGCFSRWPMLRNLELGDESLPAMIKFDECPFLKLESLKLTGSESWPMESWGESFSSLVSLKELCLSVDVLPDPTFRIEGALQRNLEFISTKLPKQLHLSRVLFHSASGIQNLLCVAISRRVPLEIVLELAELLPPSSTAPQNPIFTACCFSETDEECLNYASSLIKRGYSVPLALGTHDGDRMHALLVVAAKSFSSTLDLLLSELPSDCWASGLLYSSLGHTPLSTNSFPREADVLELLDSHQLEVDINAVSSSGITAFFEAARSSLFNEAQKLYNRGADPFLVSNVSQLAVEDISAWKDCLLYLKIADFEQWFARYVNLFDHSAGRFFNLAEFVHGNNDEHGPKMWPVLDALPIDARLCLLRCWDPYEHRHDEAMRWMDQATTEELQKQDMLAYGVNAFDSSQTLGPAIA
eukprot:TRINITY_DN6038_c0_g1_i1.p1 TRINITY_DN6038_c0_g1~~TRINITY_DN6038_c0_g1_i1.p1  ORF type:complete len:533 (+),score=56.34 TRINITY_DN6038_c0_g1_i1:79-1677(+)